MDLVLEKINTRRQKHKAKPLIKTDALQKTAEEYVAKFRSQKFENTHEKKKRFKKNIKKNCQLNGYKNAYLDFHIISRNAVNYYGNKFYYDREDLETSTHLFIGKKPSKKEKEKDDFKAFPVKTFTYEEIANSIVRNFTRDDGNFISLNNGYDKVGFALAVDRNTLFRRKIPKIKMIMILGGNRITW